MLSDGVTKLMATKLSYTQIPPFHVSPSISSIPKMIRIHKAIPATHSSTKNNCSGGCLSGHINFCIARVGKQGSGLVGDDKEINQVDRTVPDIKAELYQAIQGINRGIFGVPSAKKAEIEGLVKLLESENPCTEPTLNLGKVDGCWKLVYSTITILGSKRTKLGLRDFVTLGDFFQTIDVTKGKAVNEIKFSARGLNLLSGQLTIEASFNVATKSRVNISYDESTITPDQLMNMFRKNYELLLSVFNPEGWLEISYLDDDMRIGRDDKGNIFILEKSVADRR